ncbi:hypothetical protein ANO14919_085180 [Xylariales sp. No.14919]|nr:hypothetical protein ANO14919_085180 [Xylariales sp. No.14919]
MSHITCLLTPARALHRVLLLELANTTSKSTAFSSTSLRNPPTFKHARTPRAALAPCRHTRRAFSTTPAPAARHHLRNWDIPYQWVRVTTGSGPLPPPQRRDTVLASLPKGHSLVMVATGPTPPPPAPGQPPVIQPPTAICRIVDAEAEQRAARAAAKDAAKEAKEGKETTKTVELNWATASHDLEHKLKRTTEFLEKGLRVNILLARKRGTRKATTAECEDVVEKVWQTIRSIPGVDEYKRADGNVGAVLRLFFEGPKRRKGKEKNENDA